jgi:hypothetical protein
VIVPRSTSRGRDPLPRLLDRAIDILPLSFAIALVRKVTRSNSVTRFALRDAVSQSVDRIGEIYTRLIIAVDRPRAEVQDTFEIRMLRAWASHRGGRPAFGFLMKSLAFMPSLGIRIRHLSGWTKPFGAEAACTTYGRIPDSIPSTPTLASRNS